MTSTSIGRRRRGLLSERTWPRVSDGAAARVLTVGAVLTALGIGLAQLNVAGQATLWANAHWTIAAFAAATAASLGAASATGVERRVRGWIAVGLVLWLIGQVVWDLESLSGPPRIGTLADVFFLALPFPGLIAIRIALRDRLARSAVIAVILDSAAVFLATASLLAAIVQPAAIGVDPIHEILHVTYPILFFGCAGAGLVAAIAVRTPVQVRGTYAMVVGSGVMGVAWTGWLLLLLHGPVDPSAIANALFSIALLLVGLGAATWTRAELHGSSRASTVMDVVGQALPLGAAVAATAVLFTGALDIRSETKLGTVAAALTLAIVIGRQTILLVDRDRLNREREAVAGENARLVTELEARISDMRQVQDSLVATSKRAAVGELAAAVAHEVNNPLTGVLGYAELLLASSPPDGSPHDELDVIRTEALRARGIVRSLLDFAHPRTPERQPTDLAELARGTIDLMRYHLVRGGATINEDYGDVPAIELDPDAVRQALLNVLSNAALAISSPGRIDVATRVEGSEAVLSVADDGAGMDAATLSRAFVPFFTTRPVREGTGLGLPVAQSIVEAHGGRIEITSRPGSGTTVEIRLPLTPDAGVGSTVAAGTASGR